MEVYVVIDYTGELYVSGSAQCVAVFSTLEKAEKFIYKKDNHEIIAYTLDKIEDK